MPFRNRSPLLRPAVRAVLVDPEDRVLMVRWTHEDAVRRELLEETGLVVAAGGCGPCVAHRVHVTPMGAWDGQEEWYYLIRVASFTPRGTFSDEELAAENLTGMRWCSVADIRALPHDHRAVTAPTSAADFVERLLTDGRPAQPLELAL